MPDASTREAHAFLPGPFTVNITDEPTQTVRFENRHIFIGERLLSEDNQQQLLKDYESAYRIIRRRNYGWWFLSSCHPYFNGQLQEISHFKTNEEKIRYLFCHAERTPYSKTAEALKNVLPIFCVLLHATPRNTVAQSSARSAAQSTATSAGGARAALFPVSSDTVSEYPKRHMQDIEEAFDTLWNTTSVKKVASMHFNERVWRYCLQFNSDFKASITKSASWMTSTNMINDEVAVCEWAKNLYQALDQFRCQVGTAKGLVKTIHQAFTAFIVKIYVEPAQNLQQSDFYGLVVSLRTQVVVIHQDWRKSVDDNNLACQGNAFS